MLKNYSRWQKPTILLMLMTAAAPFSFATWMILLNNFAIEKVHFSGMEMGILQSIREIPGFLAFTVIFVLLIVKEQTLVLVSLLLLALGTAMTGFLPWAFGLYITTIVMSVGFHYFETLQTSLTLQWIDKSRTPILFGQLIAIRSFAALVMFSLVGLAAQLFALDFQWVYLFGGGLTITLVIFCWFFFPHFPTQIEQRKQLILRKRYWLFYALTFMSGARRQIFVAFAGFLMVSKFHFTLSDMSLMFIINALLNIILAQRIGKLIGRIGERKALIFEYSGLVIVFTAYALVESPWLAASLYIVDHLFFAMAIAIKTYFQKIADPADIAATAGVSFSINHIAAVIVPAILGLLWLWSPAAVFLTGTVFALISLLLALKVPHAPKVGREVMSHERPTMQR